MALTVRDIPALPGLDSLRLLSGSGGLDRKVVTAGIADYEFAPDVEFRDSADFVKDSFVITSLLFAYNNPDIIIDAVKSLHACGVSAIAYKDVKFPMRCCSFRMNTICPYIPLAKSCILKT